MIEGRPIEIAFDAKQKVTGLEIITGLDAADEFGDAAIKIIAGNVQAAVGPSPAEVGAHIKSGPVVGRRCDLSFGDRSLGGQVRCKAAASNNAKTATLARRSAFTNAPQ